MDRIDGMFAPIIIFAFNRLDVLQKCVNSLIGNTEAKDCDLYVFVDGPRTNKEGENVIVKSVCDYVKGIKGFKSLNYRFAESNQGLAPSVIAGVTEVINIYGKAIVVEDDLVVSENFLSYINQGLDKYKNERKVFSICGYSNRVKRPKGYEYDGYFCTRSSSWGWATWKDRWNSVDWELNDWSVHKKNSRRFNKWGGSDCWKMLNDWKKGRNSSWAIRFCYSQFLQDGLSLFPLKSKIANEGFDGRGTHGKKWTRTKFDFDISEDKLLRLPDKMTLNRSLVRSALRYNSIMVRIFSRIMYKLYDWNILGLHQNNKDMN